MTLSLSDGVNVVLLKKKKETAYNFHNRAIDINIFTVYPLGAYMS